MEAREEAETVGLPTLSNAGVPYEIFFQARLNTHDLSRKEECNQTVTSELKIQDQWTTFLYLSPFITSRDAPTTLGEFCTTASYP